MNFLNRQPKMDFFGAPSNIGDRFSSVNWNDLRYESHNIVQNIQKDILDIPIVELLPYHRHTHNIEPIRF